jgi:hypothetical protein
MRPGLEEERDDIRQEPEGAPRHPLPWQNQPSGGENHVCDADGKPVYDGSDAAEMFRLYGEEARAERSAQDDARAGRRRPGKRRRVI